MLSKTVQNGIIILDTGVVWGVQVVIFPQKAAVVLVMSSSYSQDFADVILQMI